MLCVLFFCVNLWEIECTLNEKRDAWGSLGRVFSHRTHRYYRTFLRTISNSQNASGIQSSQNLSAIIITNKGHNEAYILFIGVSRWLRPSLWGRGRGRGRYLYEPLCVLFFCVLLWEKENTWESWGDFSLTERTEFTEHFGAQFEPTERLRHIENTERFSYRRYR